MGKVRLAVASAAALLAMGALVAVAAAGPGPKTTGGGKAVTAGGNTATVGVNAQDGQKPRGRVNLEVRTADGDRAQHFVGRVTDYRQDGNTAYICGEVQVLQLGSNTNEGMFFEVTVQDNGQSGDLLNWYRQDSSTNCDDGDRTPIRPLTEGNLKVHG